VRSEKPGNRGIYRMKNIVLTGFMGTGKSEVGKLLAKQLGFAFIDADAEIEKITGMTISDIFSSRGEPAFREIESEVILSLAGNEKAVISTGGGAVLRQVNMDNLRKKGVIVCLEASAETIFKRTAGNDDRPLLKTDDRLAKIKEMLAARRPFYERADIMIDTECKSPMEISGEIIEEMRSYEKSNR
jgi:shikimate kinase